MKRTFSVLFFIRKTKLLKTGETNILMRITVNGQNKEGLTRRSVDPKFWKQKKEKTTGKNPSCIEINRHLDDLRAKINSIYTELEKQNLVPTPVLILETYRNPTPLPQEEPCKMFFAEFKAHNIECESLIDKEFAKSTVDRYKLCLSYFKEMCRYMSGQPELPIPEGEEEIPQPDIPFTNVTKDMIRKFEVYLKTKKNMCNNTCIRYLKCVQKITTNAFNNGWISINPFANIKYHEDKTKDGLISTYCIFVQQ